MKYPATHESDTYTISVGLSDGCSKMQSLYYYENGEAVEISSSQVSKTFTVQTDSLGYFAVIDSSISGGEDHEVTKVTLNKTTAAMKRATNYNYRQTVLPQTATNKSIRWESSDNTVATVDSKGRYNCRFGR